MRKKILLLGSGELGKELVIAMQRLGQHVVAVDNYVDAPAMQVANEFEVIDMLNGSELDEIVNKHNPDFIVPEIESIRTERFYDYEKQGFTVIPSAKAVNYTMNRKAIRDLVSIDLGFKTAKYRYAKSIDELKNAVEFTGLPCVVKPLMSSSGKGQSIIRTNLDIDKAWDYAIRGSRGDLMEVIVEEFVEFDYEITLLTLTQNNQKTLYCPPIGHRQERGDYQESWQPANMNNEVLKKAQKVSCAITKALGGNGIWGVEFFIKNNEVYFSELSPRPHDTGMVTLAGTQNFTEFELHARAILGIPVLNINLIRNGASSVVLATKKNSKFPFFSGLVEAAMFEDTKFKLFGKPSAHPFRRMGVALAYGKYDIKNLVNKAKNVSSTIIVD
ncbi:MAG: phosphoribosylglycinamide formyltransferase 2 [Flavobacteriales bacterium]|nr:phosphoribosylglycinamide formyltransferase 2 [Flavobacteriales bacterium]